MKSRLRQDLQWITREGSSFCVMAGAGADSFAPFVLACGHSALASGQIATIPLWFGALVQNVAPWALRRVASVRLWSVAMVVLQGLSVLSLGLLSLTGKLSVPAIFALVSLYWAGGWSVGPAWNTWMDSVVPQRLRARYFSRRLAFCQALQWLTVLGASLALKAGQAWGVTGQVFSGLFVLAGLARLAGAWCMAQQSEPVKLPDDYRVLGFRQAYSVVADNPLARPLLYILGAQFSMQMAAPFVVAYLTKVHGVSYGNVMLCVAAVTFSKVLALPRLGRVGQALGAARLFRLSGLGLTLVPLLWLLPLNGMAWFLLLQAFTGACTAAYELGVTLVYLDAVPASCRTSVLSRFAVFSTSAGALGSTLGAGLLGLHATLGALGYALPSSSYACLFGLAAVARLLALKLLR